MARAQPGPASSQLDLPQPLPTMAPSQLGPETWMRPRPPSLLDLPTRGQGIMMGKLRLGQLSGWGRAVPRPAPGKYTFPSLCF